MDQPQSPRTPESLALRLRAMINSNWITQALYVTAQLGLPDLLASGPQTAPGCWRERDSQEPQGPGCVAADQRRALGLQPPEARVARTRPSAARAQGDHGCPLGVGHGGARARVLRHLHADGERARRCQGCPPRRWPTC
jgi:hypothetical protein